MSLALFGVGDFGVIEVNELKALKKGDYRWMPWSYIMSDDMVRKFQNRKFKIYGHTRENTDDLMVFYCSDLEYDKEGMECPEPEKAREDYIDIEETRVWVKVKDIKFIKKTYRDLRKWPACMDQINPSGARRSFIYVCELDPSAEYEWPPL